MIETDRKIQTRSLQALTWARLLYFTLFASYGFTSAYRLLYFRRAGLTNSQIGLLIGIQPIISLIAAPTWSLLADRLGIRSRLLTILIACSVVPIVLQATTSNFAILMLLTAISALLTGPIQPLMNSVTIDLLGKDRHKYGTIRSFGSLAYAITSYIAGLLLAHWDIRFIFIACGLFTAAAAVVSIRLRTDDVALQTTVGKGLKELLGVPGWIPLMIGVFFTIGFHQTATNYFGLFMDELGASEAQIGLWQSIPSLGNVIMMTFVLPTRLQKWGSERMFVLAAIFSTLRFAGWILVPTTTAAGFVNILMLLAFPPAFLAAVDCAARYAPKGMEATSQALVTGLISPLGNSALNSLAGTLYDQVGIRSMFGIYAIGSATLAIILALFWRKRIFVRIKKTAD